MRMMESMVAAAKAAALAIDDIPHVRGRRVAAWNGPGVAVRLIRAVGRLWPPFATPPLPMAAVPTCSPSNFTDATGVHNRNPWPSGYPRYHTWSP